jgi:hypothetical protein
MRTNRVLQRVIVLDEPSVQSVLEWILPHIQKFTAQFLSKKVGRDVKNVHEFQSE